MRWMEYKRPFVKYCIPNFFSPLSRVLHQDRTGDISEGTGLKVTV